MAFKMRNRNPAQRFMESRNQYVLGAKADRRPTDIPFSRGGLREDLRSPQDRLMATARRRMLPNVLLSGLMGQGGARAGAPGTGVSAGDARNMAFGGNTFLGQAMWGRPGGLGSRGAGFDLPNPSGKGGVVNAGQSRGSRGGGGGGGGGGGRSGSSLGSSGPGGSSLAALGAGGSSGTGWVGDDGKVGSPSSGGGGSSAGGGSSGGNSLGDMLSKARGNTGQMTVHSSRPEAGQDFVRNPATGNTMGSTAHEGPLGKSKQGVSGGRAAFGSGPRKKRS
jgi:hypothetical protein